MSGVVLCLHVAAFLALVAVGYIPITMMTLGLAANYYALLLPCRQKLPKMQMV